MKTSESIKSLLEEKEKANLSEFAQKSCETRGREKPENIPDFQTEFQWDRNRILSCKAFRRLKHKTQVFFSPNDDHYRTRLTHTLEVAHVARIIAKALNLNEDLTEAIALGHDLGHTPFGHSGEFMLDELMLEGFSHGEQSVRIVKHLEKLNLTEEVIDGILHHNGDVMPQTLEGRIVRFADKIAYINHDIDDAVRAGIITWDDLPEDCKNYLSSDKVTRMDKMIYNIIETSLAKNTVTLSEEGFYYFNKMRAWMFENVYFNSAAKHQEQIAKRVVKELFNYYMGKIEKLSRAFDEIKTQRCVCDYLSGMSDRYAVQKYDEYFMPKFIQKENNDDYLYKLAEVNGLI